MRVFAVVTACVLLFACGTKPPPAPPTQSAPADAGDALVPVPSDAGMAVADASPPTTADVRRHPGRQDLASGPEAVADLFALIGKACFASFKGEYTSNMTDHPWANLTLVTDGHKKVVKHYLAATYPDDAKRKCNATGQLLAIEKKIDDVAGTRKLVGKGGKPR